MQKAPKNMLFLSHCDVFSIRIRHSQNAKSRRNVAFRLLFVYSNFSNVQWSRQWILGTSPSNDIGKNALDGFKIAISVNVIGLKIACFRPFVPCVYRNERSSVGVAIQIILCHL